MSLFYFLSRAMKKMRMSAIRGSRIHPTSKVESGCTVVASSIARHSFCGYDCSILNCDIGSFCSLASRVTIGGVAHPIDFVSTSPAFLSHKDSIKQKFAHHSYLPTIRTMIGNDVWIGEGAYIKAGVSVGHGAIVGMGSVVTKDVAPYAIVAGNPARLIRMRFDQETVDALLAMAWWDMGDDELRRVSQYFNNPRELLSREGRL